jgi:exopolysaccharide production protein ExoQ
MSATLTPVRAVSAGIYTETVDPFLFKRARTWWTLLALFLMAQANGIFGQQDNTYWTMKGLKRVYESPFALQLLTIVLWTICIGLMFDGMGNALRLMLRQKMLSAFVFLAFLSTLWSAEPQVTVRKAVFLFLLVLFGFFFSTYYSPADQRRLLIGAGVVVGLACIAMALLLPQYGISSAGEWKGVFGHKNRMGLGVFFLFSGLPFCEISTPRRMRTLLLQAILPLGLIILSRSKTSLIISALLIAIRVVGPWLAQRRRDQLPFVIYSVVFGLPIVALLISLTLDLILPLLGRDSTFSGRTETWTLLLPYMLEHLWFGYGYQAFWTNSGDSLQYMARRGAAMKGSDSGYVDTMLQFGLVGMGMLASLLAVSLRDFVVLLRKPCIPPIAYWYAGLIVATFVASFTEILFLTPNGVNCFVFVMACAGLTRYSHQTAC